jgi:hypothetical protein
MGLHPTPEAVMSQIPVDPQLAATLARTHTPVQLVDADGTVLGEFLPRPDAKTFPLGISEEELLRRERSTAPGLTTDEVLARLRKIA